MSRKKRHNIGRIFITNDSLFSKDGYVKPNRRIVVISESNNIAHICKIKSIKDKNGYIRESLVPIESYPCLTKKSGVDPHLIVKTSRNNPINLKKMKKTNSRLNKWDYKKVKSSLK